MSESKTSISIMEELLFQTLIAGAIDLHVSKLEVDECTCLHAQISFDVAQIVFNTGTFHVDDADDPIGWEKGTPIDIVLRLRSPIADRFNDVEKLVTSLLTEKTSSLRHSESWLLLEAMQKTEVPGVPGSYASFGVRTDWAGPIIES